MTSVGFRLYSGNSLRRTARYVRERKRLAMNDVDSVGGYAVPVDPMDDLQCESCQ
jgi:ABC-type phosphate/phosphonate transport system substrate-binding protein